MKWFKHISDSLDDPFIQDLMDEFGSDGYLVYFGILEILSREFTDKSPGKVEVSHRFCTRKLRLSWHKISTILLFCQKEGKVFVEDNGRKITINCPKFKDMCDNWTKRKLCSSSVVTPKKHTQDVEVEVEVDKEVEEYKNGIPFKEIIDYLNQKAKTNYKHNSKETQRCIKARFNGGFILDDFITVMDKKSGWLEDDKMCEFYRPITLFGTKFESYLNETLKEVTYGGF